MARGHQKEQSRQKNAKKQATASKSKGEGSTNILNAHFHIVEIS